MALLTRLIAFDLAACGRSFLAGVPAAVVTVVVMGAAMGPLAAGAIFPLTMAMITWGYNARVAYEEDKADHWRFLRALPVRPSLAVTVKFLSNLVVIAGYAGIVWAAACTLPLIAPRAAAPEPAGAVLGAGLGMSLAIMALFNAVYFRLGYQAAASGTSWMFVILFLPAVLVAWPLPSPGLAGAARTFLTGLSSWAAGHGPAAAVLTVLALAGLVLAGWAAAVSGFRRREF